MMRLAVYYIKGDFPQAADLEEIDYMVGEMQEKGVIPAGPLIRFYSDPNLADRTELNSAAVWADAIMLPRMAGRGRIAPFLDFLAKTGKPLIIPEIPTFPHGVPLGRLGVAEILAWNDRKKSLKFKEAAEKVTTPRGGDRGHVPQPEVRAKANEARRVASEEAALDREPDVVQAYIVHGTFNAAAKHLNKAGVPTPSGQGTWYGSTVRRLLLRLGHIEEA